MGGELLLGRAARAPNSAQSSSVEPELGEVPRRVVGDAEVDEGEALGLAPLDLVDRLLPGLDVDLGRRRRRQHEAAGQDAHAARVAGVERAVGIEVADVVRRVAGRREAVEAEHAVADDVDVLLRHRRELAPERVERVAVQPARAASPAAPGRRGAARRSRETCTCSAGCSRTSVPAAPAWSRWMWLSSRWRTSVSASAAVGEAGLQRVDRRRRPAVEERRPVVGVEQVARDHALAAEVPEVDRLGSGRH